MVLLTVAQSAEALPEGLTVHHLTRSVHSWMHPYADTAADTERGIRDALEGRPAPGGFLICAEDNGAPAGVLVMLRTGMSGYIPPYLLLFLAVAPEKRRSGIGSMLVERALELAEGAVKLHVEPENPARFLYQKLGFRSAYLDMRLTAKEDRH